MSDDARVLTSRHLGTITKDYTASQRGEVRVDLNVDLAGITQRALDEVDRMIDQLDALRTVALATFEAAIADDASTPTELWQFHHDEVDPGLARDQFVASLRLVRAGFYPDKPMFAVLDFKVRGPQTDQLLVAKFTRDRLLARVDWES